MKTIGFADAEAESLRLPEDELSEAEEDALCRWKEENREQMAESRYEREVSQEDAWEEPWLNWKEY